MNSQSIKCLTSKSNRRLFAVVTVLLSVFLYSQQAWSDVPSIRSLKGDETKCEAEIGIFPSTIADNNKVSENLNIVRKKAATIEASASGQGKIWAQKFLRELDNISLPSVKEINAYISISDSTDKKDREDLTNNIAKFRPVNFTVVDKTRVLDAKIRFKLLQGSQTNNTMDVEFDKSAKTSRGGDVGVFRKLICLTKRTYKILSLRSSSLREYSASVIAQASNKYSLYRKDVLSRQLPWEYMFNNAAWKEDCSSGCGKFTGTLNALLWLSGVFCTQLL